jgi:Leucine-rich repeat (LRR) protein
LPLLWILAAVLLTNLDSCAPEEGKHSHEAGIMEAEKPFIDTSRVLGTLELYRARRYEGIGEALEAGVDHAHKLVLYGRKLGVLSPDIGKLTSLQTLDVAYNDLAVLPNEIAGLHYLQGFYANGNKLTAFPAQVLLLPILTSLDLSENQISSIPEEIVRMDQLKRLSMDRNLLTSIPVQLYRLKDLSVLELSGNGLSVIPEGISGLTKLKKLDLSHNQLSTLPREITTLAGHLEELMVQGNRIPLEELEWLSEAMPGTRIRY